jgi:DNA-directed RNA polymerase subunit RPC12/RpoP/type IV secretory pathway protease TraF
MVHFFGRILHGAMNRSRAIRWWMWGVAAAGLLLAAMVGLRLAFLDGWLRTVRIEGSSMAPILCGTHLEVTCSDCGIRFRVDGEQLPESGRLVCPNCGFRDLAAGDFPAQGGDAVLVDRWPLLTRAPHRGEVIAYDDPHDRGVAVKRIAGLPGEKIAIRGGDLFADGQIIRKSLAEFWQTAVLVHDDGHRPKSIANAQPLRWRPQNAASHWQPAGDGYRFEPEDPSSNSEQDWVEYLHWRGDASLTPRDEPAAILDNDPHNQALFRRLNEIHDLLLTCEAELSTGAVLTTAVFVRGVWLQVELHGSGGTISASQDGHLLARTAAKRKLTGRPLTIAMGHFDSQLVLAIDGEALLVHPLDVPSTPTSAGGNAVPRLKIAAAGPATIRQLRLWRDLYLLEPHGTDRPWAAQQPLADGEYFMLGDNPPVSIDSRHWQPSGISRRQLRGLVIRARRWAP